MGCMAVKPIVDRLESEVEGRLTVIRLNVQDPAGRGLGEPQAVQYTPTLVSLAPPGNDMPFSTPRLSFSSTPRVTKSGGLWERSTRPRWNARWKGHDDAKVVFRVALSGRSRSLGYGCLSPRAALVYRHSHRRSSDRPWLLPRPYTGGPGTVHPSPGAAGRTRRHVSALHLPAD